MNDKQNSSTKTIALNKRARYEYAIEERMEAGLALEGWEVKSLRDGRVQFADSYVLLKDDEAFLFGTTINPLPTVSTHITPDPDRYADAIVVTDPATVGFDSVATAAARNTPYTTTREGWLVATINASTALNAAIKLTFRVSYSIN